MKKKEILELITINRNITRYKKLINLLNYKNEVYPDVLYNELHIERFPFKEIFPKEHDILKKEIIEAKDKLEIEIKKIEQYNCKHLIRTKHTYYEMFTHEETCCCIFCNKIINMKKNNNTIYNDINITRECAIFDGTDESEDDSTEYYDRETIYNIIIDILKDKDLESDIDLLNELKKLNLERCIINTKKKVREYYILIIGGSNKQLLDNNIILTSPNRFDSIDFLDYFLGIPRVKIEVFDNQETFNENKFQELEHSQILNKDNSRYVTYKTIEELKKLLLSEKEVPFDLVIDMSNSKEYTIKDNIIYTSRVDLELDKIFNSSYIISINEFTNEKEILQTLKEEVLKYKDAYGMIRDSKENNKYNYYHYYGNNIQIEEPKDIYKKIRKLMIER